MGRVRWIFLVFATIVLVACDQAGQDAVKDLGRESSAPATTPPGPSSTLPSPTASGPVFPRVLGETPTPVSVRTAHVDTGRPPRVQYVATHGEEQVVVLPDGRTVATLDDAPQGNEGYRHLSFAPFAGGWLAGFDFMGLNAVLVGADGAMGKSLGQGLWQVFSRAGRREIVFLYDPWTGFSAVERPLLLESQPSSCCNLLPPPIT